MMLAAPTDCQQLRCAAQIGSARAQGSLEAVEHEAILG